MSGIDASIYQNLGQGVTPILTPQQIALQKMQMQHTQAQTDLASADASMAKQKVANMQQLQDVAKGATSPEDLESRVLSVGTPDAIKLHHDLVTARLTTAKAQNEAQITQTLLQKNQNDAASNVTGGLMSLPPEQRAAAWPDALQKFAAIDPNKAAVVAQKYPQYPGDDIVTQMHAFTQSEAQRLQEASQQQLQEHQDATLAETIRHNKESEKTALIAANKPSAAITLQNMGQLPQGFDPSQPLNPGLEPMAHAIGRHDQKMQDPTTRTPYAQQVNARADWLAKNQYGYAEGAGGTDAVEEKKKGMIAFAPGQPNGTILQNADVATLHLAQLQRLGDALKNGDNQTVNQLTNQLNTWTGHKEANNYASVQAPVVSEVLKVAKGSGMINEKEEQHYLDVTKGANSPEQLQGVIDELTKVMGARAQSMEPQFRRYFPGHEITERMRPETVAAFKRVGINLGQQSPGVAPSAAPGASQASPNAAPAAPAGGALPPGVKEQGNENGVQWYRWASDGKRHTALPAGGN